LPTTSARGGSRRREGRRIVDEAHDGTDHAVARERREPALRHFGSLQAELDRTLAPFRRGGDGDFPREKLAFDDATEDLVRLHGTRFRVNSDGSLTWSHVEDILHDPCLLRLKEHMVACALDRFEGTLAELEPDFDAFVHRFTELGERDPTTGRYGRWLNPIGYWDWWELGGRFNGEIVGERRPAAIEQAISSGASRGRDVLGGIAAALGANPSEEQALIEANVELVETLAGAAARNERRSKPTALVLPIGSCADEDRWLDGIGWHEIGPGTRRFLGAPPYADYASLVRIAYERFADHAAAAVAYHF
jgi:hypothetical protein